MHLECANDRNNVWKYIQTTTNSQLDKMMDSVYHKLSKKLDALQEHKSHSNHNNETNIPYTPSILNTNKTQ